VLPEVENIYQQKTDYTFRECFEVLGYKANKVVNTDLVDHKTIFPLELNTMPGWASFYWMRYMDAHNEKSLKKGSISYWESVDLYIGGNEHATGHLLYSFWNKF
jgi:leucyl-tRNA synthetase